MRYIMPPAKEQKLKAVTELQKEESKAASRAENRRLSATDINVADVEGVINTMYEVIGSTDITNVAGATPAQIDVMAKELLAVRDAKDLIEGRESALKQYATEVINYRISASGENPAETSGFLVSPENGIKLSKEVSGGKLNVDVALLKEVLDADQFKSVTNKVTVYKTIEYPDGTQSIVNEISYELNEEALESELSAGTIGMEQIYKSAAPGKTRTSLYVRKLK
jgi:hypothetical protein